MELLSRLRAGLSALAHGILDVLAPPRRSDALVHTLSLEELSLLRGRMADSSADHAAILTYSETAVSALVWEMKYHRNPHALSLAAEVLAEIALEIAAEELSAPLLIPIPMHPRRRKERGHNQTELLCKEIARMSGTSFLFAPQALVRTRHTPPQRGLPRRERLKNAVHSMRADPGVVSGRPCIVIDDVVTTGATLKEARRALRAAGSEKVYLVALAG